MDLDLTETCDMQRQEGNSSRRRFWKTEGNVGLYILRYSGSLGASTHASIMPVGNPLHGDASGC